ncbi:hypothetical protein GCM10009731_21840 [Streptomyces globosus]
MAQKTATRIPATSPPDTLHRSLHVDRYVEKSSSDPIAPQIRRRTGIPGRRGRARGGGGPASRKPAGSPEGEPAG